VLNNEKYLYPLHPTCSVYTSELYAILQGLTTCRLIDRKIDNVLILTDSLSTVTAIQNHNPFKQCSEILQLIWNTAHLFNHIVVAWIPSHTDIKGNDDADAAAKLATKISSPVIPVYTLKDYVKTIKIKKVPLINFSQ